jgi:hypothetical protein
MGACVVTARRLDVQGSYVADEREYGPSGRRTGGGWRVVYREIDAEGRPTYVEGALWRTKAEARAALAATDAAIAAAEGDAK